ncbi:MAG: hypothetical protein ACJ8FY_12980 [Gemmataceae bacterium]
MSRKSFLLGLAVALFLLSSTAGILIILVRHEDDDFRKSSLPPGAERKEQCAAFRQEIFDLTSSIHDDSKIAWGAELTAVQINSYFDDGLAGSGWDETFAREGINDPRVIVKQDKIRLGFRYGTGFWSTRIAIDFRVWIVPSEPNVICLELQGLHAGLLPISAQSLLERVSDLVRDQKIEVSWYRHKGNPVALLRFQSDQPRAAVRLKSLALQPGKISISGEAVETGAPRASKNAAANKSTGDGL